MCSQFTRIQWNQWLIQIEIRMSSWDSTTTYSLLFSSESTAQNTHVIKNVPQIQGTDSETKSHNLNVIHIEVLSKLIIRYNNNLACLKIDMKWRFSSYDTSLRNTHLWLHSPVVEEISDHFVHTFVSETLVTPLFTPIA